MKRAVYPGSFNPMTLGQLHIITRAAEMFDVLIVAVLNNNTKKPLFSVDERVKILRKATEGIPNVEVDTFSGLLCDYAAQNDLHVAVRGLRAVTDFEYELQLAQTNRVLSAGKLDTIFLSTSLKYSYLSSSVVKEIAYFGGDISKTVPDYVADMIHEKYKQ